MTLDTLAVMVAHISMIFVSFFGFVSGIFFGYKVAYEK
jgi:hypothetical protein